MLLLAFSAELPFTVLLNRLVGRPTAALLHALRIELHNPDTPISDVVAMQVLIVLLLTVAFLTARSRLSVDRPGSLQHIVEFLHGFVDGQAEQLIGHHYERFLPFLMALGLYILTANLIGLVPGFESPTANPAVPLGCAILAFGYYNYYGVRHHGMGYLKQFMGPVWWLSPLVFLIEVISHLARMMSLTIRLFANMFAGEMLGLAFFSLIPLAVPIVFMGLHLGVALIQTYIFVLLTTVYLAGAVAEEH